MTNSANWVNSVFSNYLPEQTVTNDELMVPYFGRHGCKQFMKNKPVKFGYKLWVAATPLRYAIQFNPDMSKDDFFDPDLGLGGSVVDKLTDRPIFRFCVDLCPNNAFQIYQHQKENPGQKPLDLHLDSDVALLTRITNVTEKPPK